VGQPTPHPHPSNRQMLINIFIVRKAKNSK